MGGRCIQQKTKTKLRSFVPQQPENEVGFIHQRSIVSFLPHQSLSEELPSLANVKEGPSLSPAIAHPPSCRARIEWGPSFSADWDVSPCPCVNCTESTMPGWTKESNVERRVKEERKQETPLGYCLKERQMRPPHINQQEVSLQEGYHPRGGGGRKQGGRSHTSLLNSMWRMLPRWTVEELLPWRCDRNRPVLWHMGMIS